MKFAKSYTLIELLIYIAILSITTTLIVSLIFNLTLVKAKNNVLSEVQENIRFSLERITYSVRNAKSINSTTDSTLSLATFDPAIDPTIFSLTPEGVLKIQEGSGAENELTTNKVKVSSLSFSKINSPDPTKPSTVAIEITIEYKSQPAEPKAKTTVKTTASLRQ